MPLLPLQVSLEGIGGGSLQRQPAPYKTMWRILSLKYMRDGWRVMENTMFTDVECKTEVIAPGNDAKCKGPLDPGCGPCYPRRSCGDHCCMPFASGQTEREPPTLATDGLTDTFWQADCDPCEIEEAWLAFDFNQELDIQCFRVFQEGFLPRKSHGERRLLQ